MRRPTNTTREVAESPMLGVAMSLGRGIEAMESRGQRELVESDVIPTRVIYGGDDSTLERLGFVLGPKVEGDPLFRAATLPPGWSRKGSSHAIWSYLADAKGRTRASIFYKAAFYDRDAHLSLERRYGVTTILPEAGAVDQSCRIYVTDTGEPSVLIGTYPDGEYRHGEELREKAREWLAANRPDHADPAAYWDAP